MSIPYSNRTAVLTIPQAAPEGHPRLSNKCTEIIDALREQISLWRSVFEAFVWLSNSTIRVTFTTPAHMEDIMHQGLTFRQYPLEFAPASNKKWVTVMRLAYGIPDADVQHALSVYGNVSRVKSETHMGVNVGIRSVLMEILQPIPSQLRIRGHLCLIFYRGQARTCFKCGRSGHQKSECPRSRPGGDRPPGNEDSASQGDRNHPNNNDYEGVDVTLPVHVRDDSAPNTNEGDENLQQVSEVANATPSASQDNVENNSDVTNVTQTARNEQISDAANAAHIAKSDTNRPEVTIMTNSASQDGTSPPNSTEAMVTTESLQAPKSPTFVSKIRVSLSRKRKAVTELTPENASDSDSADESQLQSQPNLDQESSQDPPARVQHPPGAANCSNESADSSAQEEASPRLNIRRSSHSFAKPGLPSKHRKPAPMGTDVPVLRQSTSPRPPPSGKVKSRSSMNVRLKPPVAPLTSNRYAGLSDECDYDPVLTASGNLIVEDPFMSGPFVPREVASDLPSSSVNN